MDVKRLLLVMCVLQLFCEKLDVTDLEDVVPTLQRLKVTADAYPHLEQVSVLRRVLTCTECLLMLRR